MSTGRVTADQRAGAVCSMLVGIARFRAQRTAQRIEFLPADDLGLPVLVLQIGMRGIDTGVEQSDFHATALCPGQTPRRQRVDLSQAPGGRQQFFLFELQHADFPHGGHAQHAIHMDGSQVGHFRFKTSEFIRLQSQRHGARRPQGRGCRIPGCGFLRRLRHSRQHFRDQTLLDQTFEAGPTNLLNAGQSQRVGLRGPQQRPRAGGFLPGLA